MHQWHLLHLHLCALPRLNNPCLSLLHIGVTCQLQKNKQWLYHQMLQHLRLTAAQRPLSSLELMKCMHVHSGVYPHGQDVGLVNVDNDRYRSILVVHHHPLYHQLGHDCRLAAIDPGRHLGFHHHQEDRHRRCYMIQFFPQL